MRIDAKTTSDNCLATESAGEPNTESSEIVIEGTGSVPFPGLLLLTGRARDIQ